MFEYIKRLFGKKKDTKLQKASEAYKSSKINSQSRNRLDRDDSPMTIVDLYDWSPPTKTYPNNEDYFIAHKNLSHLISDSHLHHTPSHSSSSSNDNHTSSYSSHSSYDSHSSSSYSDSSSSSSSDSGGGGGGD